MIFVCRAWISNDRIASQTSRAEEQQPPTLLEDSRALQTQASRVSESQTQAFEFEDNMVTSMVQERQEIYDALSTATRKSKRVTI